MTVPMIARKAFPYAGRRLSEGDRFQARGKQDARLLSAIGHAEVAPPVTAPTQAAPSFLNVQFPERVAKTSKAYSYSRTVATKPALEEQAVEPEVKPKRQYRRRDMTSEGSAE